MIYTIPILLLGTFILALVKKVQLFECFTEGIKESIKLVIDIIPYLAGIFMAMELMRASGLSDILAKGLSPLFTLIGIPIEIAQLIILRPLSGSGSLVILENIYQTHGADSYPAMVASVLMGSTDTILYVVAVYLSTSKDKKSGLAIPIALISSFVGVVAACLICSFRLQ